MRPSLTFWILLAIIGIVLFALLVPQGGFHHSKARFTAAQADINGGFKSALGAYQVDNGSFPKELQYLVQKPDDATNWHGPYLDSLKQLVDGWGHNYIYEYPGKHSSNAYDLFSAGPDGRIGTEDDIGNWQQ